MPDRLANLRINRVAFVPGGDNPDAFVTLWKSRRDGPLGELSEYEKKDYTTAQRAAMAKKGQAIPVKNADGDVVDGRYPIANAADLSNAMRALGRSGSAPEVKAHIKKRAAALGLTDRLSDIYKDDVSKEPRLTRSRRQRLQDALDAVRGVVEEIDRKEETEVVDADKQFQLPDDASPELKTAFETLTKERDDAVTKAAELEAKVEKIDAPKDERTDVEKALDGVTDEAARALIRKAMSDGAEAKAEVSKLREEREVAEAVEKARSWKHLSQKPEEFGPMLRKVRESSPEAAAEIERILDSADAATGFKEIGKSGEPANEGSEKVDAMAAELRKAEPALSPEQAVAKVLTTPEGKAAWRESRGR